MILNLVALIAILIGFKTFCHIGLKKYPNGWLGIGPEQVQFGE